MINPFKAGVVLAAVIAGPQLYSMVEGGDLDGATALQRGAVVAAGCVAGATVIKRIADSYEAEQRAARKRAALEEALAAARDARAATQAAAADQAASAGRPSPSTTAPGE